MHGDILSVEVAVVDLELLVEPGLPVVRAVGRHCGGGRGIVVAGVLGNCVGEVAGGVNVTIEDIDDGVTGFLAGVVGSDDGGDVGVAGPGEDVDAGGMGDDDCVVARLGDGLDNIVAVVVHCQALAVGTFFGPGLQEDQAGVGGGGNPKIGDIVGRNLGVVQEVLDKSIVLLGTGLDGLEWRDKIGKAAGTRATTRREAAEFEGRLVHSAHCVLTGIVTEDSNVLRSLQGQNLLFVLQQDGSFSCELADELGVISADITASLTGEIELAGPG